MSLVEAQKLACSLFQLNEADTISASSFQLSSAPFSSTSARLAQLKLNNPEAAKSVLHKLEVVLREGRAPSVNKSSNTWLPMHAAQKGGFAYNLPRSKTYKETSSQQVTSYHMVSECRSEKESQKVLSFPRCASIPTSLTARSCATRPPPRCASPSCKPNPVSHSRNRAAIRRGGPFEVSVGNPNYSSSVMLRFRPSSASVRETVVRSEFPVSW
ncbi:hypothetical protein GQ457_13G016120 [Hibiscus cannabinus]